jgi:DNA-binding CsgD family transcriptional regulator
MEERLTALPARLLSPILVGHATSSHQVTMSPSSFCGIGNRDLIEPLILVSLRSVEPTRSAIPPEKLAKLTPTQTEVFHRLIVGDRNKQIATCLGISVYTARNHVSNILQALRCSDRLELIARCRRFDLPAYDAQKKREVPPLPVSGKRS